MRELNQAEAQLGGTLGRLFALSEAYPDLKANQNMLALLLRDNTGWRPAIV